MEKYVDDIKEYMTKLSEVINNIDFKEVERAMNAVVDTYDREGTIFIFGNGGSASTASHIVCDFNKGASIHLEKKFKFVCLNDNLATITAISNDCGYENIFSLPLEGQLKTGDMILAISGSGNSKNVIKAVEYAKSRGNKVIGLSGYNGGKLRELSDYKLHVDINDMQKAEDTHMIILHLMAQIIAKRFGHPMC